MAKKTPLDYRAAAKRMRELKILPAHYKLKNLGESEKRHIRRLQSKFADSIKNPTTKTIKVSYAAARKLRKSGLAVNKNIFLINPMRANRVTLGKDGKLSYFYDDRTAYVCPFDSSIEMHARIDEFFAQGKKGQFLSLKIGDNNSFHRKFFSAKALMAYVMREFNPNNSQAWDFLQIVEYCDNDEFNDDGGEDE